MIGFFLIGLGVVFVLIMVCGNYVKISINVKVFGFFIVFINMIFKIDVFNF